MYIGVHALKADTFMPILSLFHESFFDDKIGTALRVCILKSWPWAMTRHIYTYVLYVVHNTLACILQHKHRPRMMQCTS